MDQLTVLIITHNEEANIRRTLDSLNWARQVLVVDSFSTDGTLEILRSYPNVKVLQQHFKSFGQQCNFGLSHVTTEWTLSIDADYVFPVGSQSSIASAISSNHSGYTVQFNYWICGKPVHGSILPDRIILYRTSGAHYVNDGHGHRVVIDRGRVGSLPFKVNHDDRKPLSRWLSAQIVYARQEADKLSEARPGELDFNDRIRCRILIAPWLVLLLVYVVRGAFLSGWRGLFYAGQRFTAELLLSLFLIERKLKFATVDERPPDKER